MLTDSCLVTASGRGTSEKASRSGPTAGDDGGGASSTSTVPRILQCMGQVPWRNLEFLELVHFFSNQWCTIWVYISIQCACHKFKYMSFLFFEYFSSVAWGRQVIDTSRYMADYESTAYMSLERLKEQHGEELGKFQEMIRPLASGSSIKNVFLLVSTFSDSRLTAILCVPMMSSNTRVIMCVVGRMFEIRWEYITLHMFDRDCWFPVETLLILCVLHDIVLYIQFNPIAFL